MKLNTNMIKENLLQYLNDNKEIFVNEIIKAEYMRDIKQLQKDFFKKSKWKRMHKVKIDDTIKRIFVFEEVNMWIPEELRGFSSIKGSQLKFMSFSGIIAIYSNTSDEEILNYELLYCGEKSYQNDLYKKYI